MCVSSTNHFHFRPIVISYVDKASEAVPYVEVLLEILKGLQDVLSPGITSGHDWYMDIIVTSYIVMGLNFGSIENTAHITIIPASDVICR